MASQGPYVCGTATNDASVGNVAWATPNLVTNLATNNGLVADLVSPLASLDQTNLLKCTNFGFTIPAGSSVDGVYLEAEVSEGDSGNTIDYVVRLVKGGTIVGTNKLRGGGYVWPAFDPSPAEYATWGGATDTWGVSLGPGDVNATDFGVVIAADNQDGITGNPFVDHLRLTVYYTAGAGGGGARSQAVIIG